MYGVGIANYRLHMLWYVAVVHAIYLSLWCLILSPQIMQVTCISDFLLFLTSPQKRPVGAIFLLFPAAYETNQPTNSQTHFEQQQQRLHFEIGDNKTISTLKHVLILASYTAQNLYKLQLCHHQACE